MSLSVQERIFVSTSGIRARHIAEAVRELAERGFSHIELSGGTKAYHELKSDLLALKARYRLTYRCHNYFPPPKQNFVMNMSSSGETLAKTLQQARAGLALSRELGANKLGLHAGFRIDPKVNELGQRISSQELTPYDEAVERFETTWLQLQEEAREQQIELYVENNVFSEANKQSFDGQNPFLLTHLEEYRQLQGRFAFNLLLDVAHLKVSCQTLGLNFTNQLFLLLEETDYVHISDNDGSKDANEPLLPDSSLYAALQRADLTGKSFTLEVYSGIEEVRTSYDVLSQLLNSSEKLSE